MFALLMSSVVNLLFVLSQDPELHHPMVMVARAAPDLHTPNQFFLCKNQVLQNISPLHVLSHLYQEIVINALQKSAGLLLPCCVAPPTDIGVVNGFCEDLG